MYEPARELGSWSSRPAELGAKRRRDPLVGHVLQLESVERTKGAAPVAVRVAVRFGVRLRLEQVVCHRIVTTSSGSIACAGRDWGSAAKASASS